MKCSKLKPQCFFSVFFPHKAQLHLIPSDFTADECKEHLLGRCIQSTTAPKYFADISRSVVVVKSVPLF